MKATGRPLWIFLVGAIPPPKAPSRRAGFPWISSSETRLINGLRGIGADRFFSSLSPRVGTNKVRVSARNARSGRIAHGDECSTNSNFRNKSPSEPPLFRRRLPIRFRTPMARRSGRRPRRGNRPSCPSRQAARVMKSAKKAASSSWASSGKTWATYWSGRTMTIAPRLRSIPRMSKMSLRRSAQNIFS